MERKYTYVLSDTHIGKTCRDNLRTLLGYLEWVAGPKANARKLILLGDIFDEWICGLSASISDNAETMARFREDGDVTIAALQQCEKRGVKIVYVLGNHDARIGIRWPILKRWIVGEKYEEEDCVFLHGHQFDVFNSTRFAPVTKESGDGAYPLGYYIARAARDTNVANGKGAFISKLLKGLDGVTGIAVDLVMDGERHDKLIRTIFGFLGQSPERKIAIDTSTKEMTTIEKVIRAYSPMFNTASKTLGAYHEMLMAAGGNLLPLVSKFCGTYGTVVAGHIHHPGHHRVKRPDGVPSKSGGKRMDFYSTGSWRKDGSIVGLRIGTSVEFWKLSQTKGMML